MKAIFTWLLAGLTVATQATETNQTFAGRWNIIYWDEKLTNVVGTAVVDEDEKKCEVTLWQPQDDQKFELNATEIKREGDTLKIKLEGASPRSEKVERTKAQLPRLEVPEAVTNVTAQVGDFTTDTPVRRRAVADRDMVDLELRFDGSGNLSGTWQYRADVETERAAGGYGRVGSFTRGEENGRDTGWQRGPEVWERARPVISGVVVLEDQFRWKDGFPSYGYPFDPKSVLPGQRHRQLFVYGWNLPKRFAEKIDLQSTDPHDETISYAVDILPARVEGDRDLQRQIDDGWKKATVGYDEKVQRIIRQMDAMVVTATLRRGVTGGDKAFTLNGETAGDWLLAFGDMTGHLTFARHWREKIEATESALAPSLAMLELRTDVALPVTEFPVHIQRARAGQTTDVLRTTAKLLEGETGVYQTLPFMLYEEGKAAMAATQGVDSVAVLADDRLVAVSPTKALLLDPPTAVLRIAPAREYGTLWKDALLRAARTHPEIDLTGVDLGKLSGKKVDEITNYAFLAPLYGKIERTIDDVQREIRDWKRLDGAAWVQKKLEEAAERTVESTTGMKIRPEKRKRKSNIVEKVSVTCGDQAALILLRDAFVKMMESQTNRLIIVTDDRQLPAVRQMIAPMLEDTSNPLSHIRVTKPPLFGNPLGYETLGTRLVDATTDAGTVPLSFAVSDVILKSIFSNNVAAAEAWSLGAVKEGLENYKQAVYDSITKARNTEDSDIEGLIDLASYGFEPVAEQLLPQLLKLEESAAADGRRQLQWVSDDAARGAVCGVKSFVEAVRAQREYSELDTQMVLILTAAATLPAMWTEAAWAVYLAAAADIASGAVVAYDSVGALQKNWQEQHFALGASLVLGADRYDEAVASDPGFWMTVLNVAGAVGPGAFSGWSAATKFRFASNLNKLEKGGLNAFRQLSEAHQRDFMAYAVEARTQRATKGAESLTATQKRALAIYDELGGHGKPRLIARGPKPEPPVEPPPKPRTDEPPPPKPPKGDEPPPKPSGTDEPPPKPPKIDEPPPKPPKTDEPPPKPPTKEEPPAKPPKTDEPPSKPPKADEPPPRTGEKPPPAGEKPPPKSRPTAEGAAPSRPTRTAEPTSQPPRRTNAGDTPRPDSKPSLSTTAERPLSTDEAAVGAAWSRNKTGGKDLMTSTGKPPAEIARDLDRYLETVEGIKDPALRAKQVENFLKDARAQMALNHPKLRDLNRAVKEGRELSVDDVMDIKTDPQAMRSLKNADDEVKAAFNAAEEKVYAPQKQAIVDSLKNQQINGKPAPWAGKEIWVDEFRTPGASAKKIDVNTDRDYRVLYRNERGEAIEVPRKHWRDVATDEFAKASKYTEDKLKRLMAPAERDAFERGINPRTGKPFASAEERAHWAKEKWAELHQQLATDKWHPEACLDFSDQMHDRITGQLRQIPPNIKRVLNKDGTLAIENMALLQDAQRFGMMYNEKADAYLRLRSARWPDGNKLEAMAQMNKGIDMLGGVRAGYEVQGVKAGKLSDRFQEAERAVQSLKPYDCSITARDIASIEQRLHDLGFKGGLRDFNNALDSQFHALNMFAPPPLRPTTVPRRGPLVIRGVRAP